MNDKTVYVMKSNREVKVRLAAYKNIDEAVMRISSVKLKWVGKRK